MALAETETETETSRSQVTITLGRSGQVVKRAGASQPIPAARSKRSVRDRLGLGPGPGPGPGPGGSHNKRLRGDDRWNFKASNCLDANDLPLSKDDLRFKIMKRTQSNSQVDLRDTLSRSARPSSTANPITSYRSITETRHRAPARDNNPRHERQISMPEVNIPQQPSPISTSLRTSPHMGFVGHSYYSPWTLDHIRRKSPQPQGRRDDVTEISRPVKQPLSVGVGPMKPLVTSTLPPRGNMQPTPYPVQQLTVEGFLRSLGLEKYLISFKVEEVDMSALTQMGDRDLKELGIPMGPRKKILLALLARTGRQAR